jgi:hypothetical protein
VGSSLLATKRTAVEEMKKAPLLFASAPPVPLNLTESETKTQRLRTRQFKEE